MYLHLAYGPHAFTLNELTSIIMNASEPEASAGLQTLRASPVPTSKTAHQDSRLAHSRRLHADELPVLQTCLLTKAVLVAIYGSEQLLPSHHGRRDGLVLLFGPLLVCSCLTAAEHLLLGSYISGTHAGSCRVIPSPQ